MARTSPKTRRYSTLLMLQRMPKQKGMMPACGTQRFACFKSTFARFMAVSGLKNHSEPGLRATREPRCAPPGDQYSYCSTDRKMSMTPHETALVTVLLERLKKIDS